MEKLILGYGSLINLESASRTLKRDLLSHHIVTGVLEGYQRGWTLWDDVMSSELNKNIRAVFLNLIPKEAAYLNGVMVGVSEEELQYFIKREKNYNCVDVTDLVTIDHGFAIENYRVFTFVGKHRHLVFEPSQEYAVFNRYINIVNTGINSFGPNFAKVFEETTQHNPFQTLDGTYTFINTEQQNAR